MQLSEISVVMKYYNVEENKAASMAKASQCGSVRLKLIENNVASERKRRRGLNG